MLYFHLVYISMYFGTFEGSYDIWNHFSFNALFPSGLHLYVLWSFWRKLWYMKPLFFQCSISIWFTSLCTLVLLREAMIYETTFLLMLYFHLFTSVCTLIILKEAMIYETTFLLMLYFHLVYISMYFGPFEGSYDIWNHFSFNALFPSGLHLYVLWSLLREAMIYETTFLLMLYFHLVYICMYFDHFEGSYDIWNHFSFNALFPSCLHLYVLWSFWRKLWYMKPLFF